MIYTEERRSEPRRGVQESGSVAVDEHTMLGCFVHDVSPGGVKITLINADVVPSKFVLITPYLGKQICTIVWRTEEMIGAKFE